MIVLGICGGHDANWCIFKDGKMLGAFEKERFTRKRHDSGYVMDLVNKTLVRLGLCVEQVDLIVTSEHNHKGTQPGLEYVTKNLYNKPDEWVEQTVLLAGKKILCFSIPHHLCHASYAYYTSCSDESAVITWDGGGDFYTVDAYTSTSVSLWKDRRLQWFEQIGNCDIGSLWHIYSKVVFDNPFAAGKLMGLAATGSPELLSPMSDYVLRPTRGILSVQGIKNCWPDEDLPPFNSVKDWKDKTSRDLAYAIQEITNSVGFNIAKAVYDLTKAENLALSGGVALNGYLNTTISKNLPFKKISIPPSVHDGGLSIGAVMFALNCILGLSIDKISEKNLVFSGLDYSISDCEEALKSKGLSFKRLDYGHSISTAVDDITNGKIIAWFEGRSEHGPRALGHRSILASPVFSGMKDRLNNTIKFREPFRPIAPVVLESDISFCTDDITASPFMMHIVDTKKEFQRICPSAVHLDGSARVQTVNKDNPMGLMLEELKRRGLPPAILNTSFNVNTPIVETPSDAVEAFLKVPIDTLYLNGCLMVKGAHGEK